MKKMRGFPSPQKLGGAIFLIAPLHTRQDFPAPTYN